MVAVWPTPVVSIATLMASEADWETLPSSPHHDNAKLIFREDSFDPVTRVRRGHLYEWRDGALQQATLTGRSRIRPAGLPSVARVTKLPRHADCGLSGPRRHRVPIAVRQS